ncbi:MAG: 4-hydroxythreonine-4-phosphate dehydrogenase [Halieaceae bacterium]|jgi:4-hydroxythreonine-4-phosphate dehydrogenase
MSGCAKFATRLLLTSNNCLKIAISAGEPAGIGPDIVLALAQQEWPAQLVVIADRNMLRERAQALQLELCIGDYEDKPAAPSRLGELTVIHQPLATAAIPGQLDVRNADAVLRALQRATRGCLAGEFAAMVTAPVNKAVINDSGTPFFGHTEFLAELTDTQRVVMLLVAGDLRIALATTHLPLSEVPAAITASRLEAILDIMHADLQQKFGIAEPRISVLGLNPHAGEGGHLGREEIEIITPAIERARAQGMQIRGPLPADTAFSESLRSATDAYLAMYHDQGLPVLKFVGFGGAVNITLGLPIIRSSVDHGTALDIAASGKAEAGSLFAAVHSAIDLIERSA